MRNIKTKLINHFEPMVNSKLTDDELVIVGLLTRRFYHSLYRLMFLGRVENLVVRENSLDDLHYEDGVS